MRINSSRGHQGRDAFLKCEGERSRGEKEVTEEKRECNVSDTCRHMYGLDLGSRDCPDLDQHMTLYSEKDS